MKFYVYAYLREDGTPYYIGKGNEKRAWNSHKRTNGTDLLPKDKNKIVIIVDGLEEQVAFDYEEFLIFEYGRKDLGTGILRNVSNGGGFGSSGYKHTEEALLKISTKAEESANNRVAEGTHNFQHQVHPNLGGKVSSKLISNGTHNLLKRKDGTSVASDRVASGTHHFVDPVWKKKHGEEHSVWCQKQIENGEHVFAKANPARTKVSCIGCHKETNLMGLNRFHKHNKEKNVTSAI
jgi:hypothetical protein